MDIAGQVGLIHSKHGFAPWIIRVGTNSYWSHMVVAVDGVECVSAEPGGALVRRIDEYSDVVWSRFVLDEEQKSEIVGWALRHVGTPYSWADVYVAGIAALLRDWTPRWVERIAAGTDKLICSQLADLALQAGGIHVFRDHRPRGAVTPASFGRFFYRMGWASTP